MYEAYFGLREAPFALTPDTGFFFNHKSHHEALNVLFIALENGEGFLKITGEVGTGKTLLCRKLLNGLDTDWVSAYIPNPFLGPDALREAIAEELGVILQPGEGQHQLLRHLHSRLIELAGEGKRVMVCVDEAQALSDESLEALRLISNLETEKRKLLHVVLFGQPELNDRLDSPRLRQLKQRISFSYHLTPLDRQGVRDYLAHRLGVAGYNGAPLFSDRAVAAIHRASGGIPRLVNLIAHKSLMVAYGEGIRSIGSRQVRMAAADTEGALALTRNPSGWLGALLLLTALAGAAVLWRGWAA